MLFRRQKTWHCKSNLTDHSVRLAHALAGGAIVQEKVREKVIVVTGASGALGKVVVETALALGNRVAAIDFAAAQGAPVGDRLDLGGVDLTDAAQARQAIDFGGVAFRQTGCADQYCRRLCLRDGCRGRPENLAAHVCAQFDDRAQRLARRDPASAGLQRRGRIVNIGAFGALQAGPGMGAYAASKAGVHRLTKALAAEHKGRITVNAVLPSIIDTAANRESMPKADFSKWVAPRELADVILFLVSDAASAVTGALLPVTGRV